MNNQLLFSSKFKNLGLLLIILPVLTAIVLKVISFQSAFYTADFTKMFLQSLLCLGLFFTVYSKYKDDDEMLYMIRLQLALHSLFVAIIYLVISPLVDLFVFKDPVKYESAVKIIMFILLWQNLMFQYKRYQLKKELNEK